MHPTKLDFSDKAVGRFNYEFVRGISTQLVGAAEFGECLETLERIKNNDFESWINEWTVTAHRVADYAAQTLRSGDAITARAAFVKASNYYRMAVFYAAHTDPRHTELWKRSKECLSCA